MTDDALGHRVQQGIGLLTAYLNRDSGSGALDESLLRSMFADGPVSDDDVIAGMGNMLLVSEMVMMMYVRDGGRMPAEVLRELAAHQQRGE